MLGIVRNSNLIRLRKTRPWSSVDGSPGSTRRVYHPLAVPTTSRDEGDLCSDRRAGDVSMT